MKYRKLGKTDMNVSVICQGCWSIVTDDWTWGPNEIEDSIAAIRASLDSGVNFFDTAEGYGDGESEEILARALGPRRKDVVVASKLQLGPPPHAEQIRCACDASLKRLGADCIDLYQIHWPRPHVDIAEVLETLEALKAAGKIRAAGVSNFGTSYLGDLLAAGSVESNQLCYSLLWRPIEHAVQPLCAANGMSILCYSPLAQGLLTGKFASADDVPEGRARTRLFSKDRPQSRHAESGCEGRTFAAIAEVRRVCESAGVAMAEAALAWLLSRQAVTSVIAGARNARQARQNARAGDLTLPPKMLDALTAATEPVKAHAGTNADFWQSESRMEKAD